VLKGTSIPDGRGIFSTTEGKVFIRYFKNGKFAEGITIYLYPLVNTAGIFSNIKARHNSELKDFGILNLEHTT
jgi:hypothetical protein